MKLNPDCVRDILLVCEGFCTATRGTDFESGTPLTIDGRTYQSEELLYHLNQCDMNGYFTRTSKDLLGNYHVRDLTPKAHEFIADIREDTNWNKTKEVAKSAGVSSLTALKDIAVRVVAAIISEQFKG